MITRVGFHYHVPFSKYADGRVIVPGYLGRFLDSLANCVGELICFMHSASPSDVQYCDYSLQSANIRWIDIGPFASVPKRTLLARNYVRQIRGYEDKLDVLLIRGPSPLLPAVAHAAGRVPVALLLVGNYMDGIDDLPQPRWRKEAIRAWSYWNYRQQLAVARRSLTFVNSHKLYEQLRPHVPRLVETRTTTLTEEDFFEREDTCQSRPIRLLYTGRMDRAKGLFEIFAAVDSLRQHGHDVVLDLVGWPQKGDTVVEELLRDADKRGIRDYIHYHGFKAVGPDLFSYYRQADIYVIASQSNFEGFPRTIWEAMAHSLPVVATRVGSIPHFLQHSKDAWLLDANNCAAIAAGVEQVLQDSTRRKALIRNARKLARENTLERRAYELIDHMSRWLLAQ